VRAAGTVPRASRGWDAEKVNGRKRHIAVDTTGPVLDAVITAASVQDRQAARPLPWNARRACRHVRLVWAGAGYTGKLAAWAAALKMTLQIVAKRDRMPSRYCPAAGLPSGLSPGSASTGAPPAITSTCPSATKP
jgi:Transposase DDE domain